MKKGESQLLTEIPGTLLAAASFNDDRAAIVDELGLRSAMVVPLVARGRTLGAITFVSAESGRRYDRDDLALAEDLDGLVDWLGEMAYDVGIERLTSLLCGCTDLGAEEIAERIEESIDEIGSEAGRDDMAFVVLRVAGYSVSTSQSVSPQHVGV